jgi:hypothetical protein
MAGRTTCGIAAHAPPPLATTERNVSPRADSISASTEALTMRVLAVALERLRTHSVADAWTDLVWQGGGVSAAGRRSRPRAGCLSICAKPRSLTAQPLGESTNACSEVPGAPRSVAASTLDGLVVQGPGLHHGRENFVERADLLNRPLRTRAVGGVGAGS